MSKMRKFNEARMIVWASVFVASMALWAWAILTGNIGSTVFIGHVSMLAIVLSAGAALEASLPSFQPKGDSED